jgi:hypothetical protein
MTLNFSEELLWAVRISYQNAKLYRSALAGQLSVRIYQKVAPQSTSKGFRSAKPDSNTLSLTYQLVHAGFLEGKCFFLNLLKPFPGNSFALIDDLGYKDSCNLLLPVARVFKGSPSS